MTPEEEKQQRIELAAGSQRAFQQIYDLYWEDLYAYAARILDEPAEVEDIVQEVFVKLWGIRDSLGHVDSLKAYLLVMARNSVLKYLSRHKGRMLYGESIAAFARDYSEDPEQTYVANQLSAVIDAEIATLPNKMQQIFILSRKQQLSHKEIAELLDISDQTVKKQINNSLRYLKARIERMV